MNKLPQKLIWTGLTGLAVVMACNLYAHFVTAQPAAIPLGEYWWLSWFPAYLIWLVLLVAGLRGRARRKALDAQADIDSNAPANVDS